MRSILLLILLQFLVGCDPDKGQPHDSEGETSGSPSQSGASEQVPSGWAQAPDPKHPARTEPKPKDTTPDTQPEVSSIPLENWDCSYAEKKWGVKLKSAEPYWTTAHKLLFEFTKDVEDKQGLREAFPVPARNRTPSAVWYFFDKDNVVISKAYHDSIEGELTGIKGDAFRVVVIPSQDRKKLPHIRKAALRSVADE